MRILSNCLYRYGRSIGADDVLLGLVFSVKREDNSYYWVAASRDHSHSKVYFNDLEEFQNSPNWSVYSVVFCI